RREYISKKSGGQRPLGIPSVDDKLVQEVARRLLEGIYEPVFKKSSHGFRQKHSCHTTLNQIQKNFTGVKWFVEGDIKGFFDNIDHHILIGL
ncbi:group II intron reverse transcriptase/maturase, partial [Bacillus thuringiensis]|nr:group II intron reverse transcriptase/maturase [Bacillus thuringiensis]